jgi:hypothetical protein
MPVPRDRTDDAYFAPLARLRLKGETELSFGLVHVNEVDWPLDVSRQSVGKINHIGHVGGLDDMLMIGIAITEMEQ